jgi:hypothetical protein
MKRFSMNVLLGVVAFAIPAFATPIVDFTTGNTSGGSISSSGTTWTGTGISFGSLNATGTTSDGGVWALSGPATAGFSFSTSTNTGTFTLTGTATWSGDGTNHTSQVTLLTGNIAGTVSSTTNAFTLNLVANGTQLSTVDNSLETFLGISTTQNYTVNGNFAGVSGGGSPYTANSSDLKATAISATPEPVSAFLLGSGLLALGLSRRRSVRK